MTKIIAHRGLMEGPDKELENKPEQILKALQEGFDAEVDVWKVDEKWFLGHDAPTYPIDQTFLRTHGLWIHCKNVHALEALSMDAMSPNHFWHQTDRYTLTSRGFIWVYPGEGIYYGHRSVLVLPEEFMTMRQCKIYSGRIFGICTDFAKELDNTLKS